MSQKQCSTCNGRQKMHFWIEIKSKKKMCFMSKLLASNDMLLRKISTKKLFRPIQQYFNFLKCLLQSLKPLSTLFNMGIWLHIYETERVIKSVSQIKRVNLLALLMKTVSWFCVFCWPFYMLLTIKIILKDKSTA